MENRLNKTHERRFSNSLKFLHAASPPPARILDLGTPNELGRRMQLAGYEVTNTEGDLEQVTTPLGEDADLVTAFEILEHLVSPYNVCVQSRPPDLLRQYHFVYGLHPRIVTHLIHGIGISTNLRTGSLIGSWSRPDGKSFAPRNGPVTVH